MEIIKKIDIHAHVTAFPQYAPANRYTKYRMPSAEEVLAFYDKLNIEKGILLPLTSPEAQWLTMSSENCKYVADQYPDRFVWFCGVDPRSGNNSSSTDLGYLLEHYKALGAKGLGELTAQLYADDPKMENLFACCAEAKMPVTIHIASHHDGLYGIVDEPGLYRLEKMLKKYPDLIILGHSQRFWCEIGTNNEESYPKGKVIPGRLSELMREYGNLYGDLSAGSGHNALMRDPDHAARFVEEFADRLLYGCDICATFNTHPFEFNDFLDNMRASGQISETNYRKLVRENAIKLLDL